MRRTPILLGVAFLLLCAVPVFAGTVNEIVLGSSPGTPVHFIGTGGSGGHQFNVTFNIQNLVATGFGTLESSGFYSIVNSGSTVYSNGSCGSGCFMLGQTGPLKFSYGSAPGMSDLLTGDLFLSSIVQAPGQGGIFNDQLIINFTVTGGDLASAFQNGNGVVTLTIKFTTNQDLATIMNHQNLLAKVVSGAVFPVPEPASLAILGASLLGFGALGKRKKLFAH